MASPIEAYIEGGRLPWSVGYSKFKNQFLSQVMRDPAQMELFRTGARLPDGFGPRLDERVVEYPWVLSRLARSDGWVVDAGSTFNAPLILDLPLMEGQKVMIYTFDTDYITLRPPLSYVFGDLRSMVLKDGAANSVVCISTLEHVGFSYEFKTWNKNNPYPNAQPDSFKDAIREFSRILAPGGQLLLTVPFGKYEDHGWLQQFDKARVEQVKKAFGGRTATEAYYRYTADGWQVSTAEECATLEYYNIHAADGFDEDHAAAARAVVCLELIKPEPKPAGLMSKLFGG